MSKTNKDTQFKAVNRASKDVKGGDKIRIVDRYGSCDPYEIGDVLNVLKVDKDGDVRETQEHGGYCILNDEFEIVEEVTAESGCGKVKITTPDGTTAEGSAEEVAKLFKAMGFEGSESSEEGVEESFEYEGKTVVVTGGELDLRKGYAGWSEDGQGIVKYGSVGEIVEKTGGGIYVKFDEEVVSRGNARLSRFYLKDGEYEFIDADNIEVGDAVKLNIAEGGTPKLGWSTVINGDVVEVIYKRNSAVVTYDAKFPSHNNWTGVPGVFKLIAKGGYGTEDAEKDSEDVREYEIGDIVELVSGAGTGTLHGTSNGGYYEICTGLNGGGKHRIASGTVETAYAYLHQLKLICKAEDRADK